MARRRLKVSSPREVRATLAKIINMLYNDEIDSKQANSIIAACNAILSGIRTDEQQQRLDELEALITEKDKQ